MTKNRDTDADVHNERRLGERIGKLLRGVNPRAQLHAFTELSATVGRAAGLTEAEFLGLCALYFRGKAPLSAGADLNASAHSAASAVRTPVVSLDPAEPPAPGLDALPDACCVECGSSWFSHLVADEETGEVLRVVCGSCGLKQAMGAAKNAWSIREAGRVEREAFAQAAEVRDGEIVDAPITADQEQLQDELLLAQESIMRMRRELKALRDNARNHALTGDLFTCAQVADEIDAILAGPGKESTDAE